jgi:23S rRNA pseudouridine1911/1915/1917 synthase
LTHLSKQFFDRTIERRYVALVWGDIEDDGTIIGHTGRSLQDRKVFTVFPNGEYGKHAVTHYKVLERFGYVTLVECKLETGRTHQIRVHMKYKGHTLFGDPEYGGDKVLKGTTFAKYKQFVQNCFEILPRQALHARSLEFEHPTTGEWMKFEKALPDDMSEVLEKWRKYTATPE